MTVAPGFLTLSLPSDDEKRLIELGRNQLGLYYTANNEAKCYYEGTHTVKQFGISIPPSMQNVPTPTGWGGTTVDVLEERLDWLGWRSDDDSLGLDEVYEDNDLGVDSGLAHLDSLIFGVSFVSLGSGLDGEPSPLITPHSPTTMTGWWDRRTRRLSAAFTTTVDADGFDETATVYEPDETVTYGYQNGLWRVVDRDRHNLHRVPVVIMPNRMRASRETGRSEITKSVRYYVDAATRTLLGLEVNREFYNAPQRFGLNLSEDMFKDAAGQVVSQWTSIMGRMQFAPPNGEGEPEPKIVQFDPSSPAPYLDQVKGYAALLSAEVGMPASYLGIETSNPPSADAIRASEARLVKRAERRQVAFGRAWREVGRLALLIRDGEVPESYSDVQIHWRDAATPTRAAAADEAAKLVGAQILPPDSRVTLDRIGVSPAEQKQLQADLLRSRGGSGLQQLLEGANSTAPAEAEAAEAEAMAKKAAALGQLIRAGVDPDDAARRLGLAGIKFTGAVPVSLRLPESDAAQVEDK